MRQAREDQDRHGCVRGCTEGPAGRVGRIAGRGGFRAGADGGEGRLDGGGSKTSGREGRRAREQGSKGAREVGDVGCGSEVRVAEEGATGQSEGVGGAVGDYIVGAEGVGRARKAHEVGGGEEGGGDVSVVAGACRRARR